MTKNYFSGRDSISENPDFLTKLKHFPAQNAAQDDRGNADFIIIALPRRDNILNTLASRMVIEILPFQNESPQGSKF